VSIALITTKQLVLKDFYKDHSFFTTENMFFNGNYFVHIEMLKKSSKMCDLLKNNTIKGLFDKMIKLNDTYSKKDLQFFGYKKKKTHSFYDRAKKYGFYLGLHNSNYLKFLNDL